MGPNISVVIPTYNRKLLLSKSIESLTNQIYSKEKYEIIVVDDGSSDGSEEMVNELMDKSLISLRYFKQKNKGPAVARNFGIREAKGDIIAFTDDDCVADKQWLKNIAVAFKNEAIGGVEGKVIMTGESTPFTQDIENLKGGRYMTANIAYKKKLLYDINMFDELFPFPICEDTDLANRILKSNNNIVFCDKAIIFHPAEEITMRHYFKKLRFSRSYIRLYKKNPDIFTDFYEKKMVSVLLFGIFMRPFSIKHCRYIIRNPRKIIKHIVISVLVSVSCIILLFSVSILWVEQRIKGRKI